MPGRKDARIGALPADRSCIPQNLALQQLGRRVLRFLGTPKHVISKGVDRPRHSNRSITFGEPRPGQRGRWLRGQLWQLVSGSSASSQAASVYLAFVGSPLFFWVVCGVRVGLQPQGSCYRVSIAHSGLISHTRLKSGFIYTDLAIACANLAQSRAGAAMSSPVQIPSLSRRCRGQSHSVIRI